MVAFGQKCLYSGKSSCFLAKVVLIGQGGFIRPKVVVFRQELDFAQSGSMRAKVVVFGQSGCIRVKGCCIRARWFYSDKVVVFGQKWLYAGKTGYIGQK